MEDVVYARQSVDKQNSIPIEGKIALSQRAAGKPLKTIRIGATPKKHGAPTFLQLMKDIQAGKVGKLCVYRLDRFSRSVADFGDLWKVLQKHHVEFVSTSERFDGIHGVLLVGTRDRSQKKYSNVIDHSVSVLNSLGIVPADLWLRCQNKLQHNQQIGNSEKGTYTWFTGLIKCAKCGYRLKVKSESPRRRLLCSGRYNLSHCTASINGRIEELEHIVSNEIEMLLEECGDEQLSLSEDDTYKSKPEELDRRAERLMDAYAESNDLTDAYLQRALAKLEQERQTLLEARKRKKSRPVLPDNLVFSSLSFDEKKRSHRSSFAVLTFTLTMRKSAGTSSNRSAICLMYQYRRKDATYRHPLDNRVGTLRNAPSL